jgi:hypothetical protein
VSDPNEMPDIVVQVGMPPQPMAMEPQPVPQADAADLTGLTADGHASQPAPFSPESTADAADAVRAVYGAAADMQPQEMIDPEQHLRGVLQAGKDWWRAKLICDMLQGAAKGLRRLPVMKAPLGETDDILGVDSLEIDWHLPLREAYQAQDQEAITTYMTGLCLPLNNLYVEKYTSQLVGLREGCMHVIKDFTGGNEVPNLKADVTFEQLVAATAAHYREVRPHIEYYLQIVAALAKGDMTNFPVLNLENTLAAFDSTDPTPEARQQFLNKLVEQRLQAQREGITKCVKIMAAATTRALNMMTAK